LLFLYSNPSDNELTVLLDYPTTPELPLIVQSIDDSYMS